MNYGKLSMHVGQVDVVKLLSQLLEEFYPSFVDKNLSYELQSNVPVKVITADGNLLARLFDNLINNAIKYGADGKRIMVKLHADDEIVTVSVINYGYVIPADELPLIFNKFYRVEQSRSTNTGGTGLGLAISKNIVDMHGGTITVTSDLSGTVFTVKLKVNFDVNKENFGKIGLQKDEIQKKYPRMCGDTEHGRQCFTACLLCKGLCCAEYDRAGEQLKYRVRYLSGVVSGRDGRDLRI